MKYLDHLKELRNRLLISFLFLIISFIFFFYNASYLGELLTKPLFKLLIQSEEKRMIFTGLPEVFVSNLRISLFASLIFSMPFLILQIVIFLSPAMYKREKKIFVPIFFLVPILFLLGITFAYFVLIPFIWSFFISFENFFSSGLNLELESRYSEYMKLTMFLLLASGMSFEFPILLIILTKFGIVDIKFLRKNRKYFFLGILVFSALFTPPDIISQLGIAIPLIIFYEVSIAFIFFFMRK